MSPDIKKMNISTEKDLQLLINRLKNGSPLMIAVEFESDELWDEFASAIGFNIEEFERCYYYFDKNNSIHISESSDGYVWISTMGLVARSKISDNKYVNAFCSQKAVTLCLLDNAISLANDEQACDINGAPFGLLEELTIPLYTNIIFYYETLVKMYLSINGQAVPRTHSLEELLACVRKTMFSLHQNNTIFHAYVIPPLETLVKYIGSIPGPFKEQNVKYDDNPNDFTVIDYNVDQLKEHHETVKITFEILWALYSFPNDCIYLRQNLYQRVLKKCVTSEEKERFAKKFEFLLEEP